MGVEPTSGAMRTASTTAEAALIGGNQTRADAPLKTLVKSRYLGGRIAPVSARSVARDLLQG